MLIALLLSGSFSLGNLIAGGLLPFLAGVLGAGWAIGAKHRVARPDDWPALWARILNARIVVIDTPIWLGEPSCICRLVIEQLYGMSGESNHKGQSIFCGRVGGAVVTGNEDGVEHCAMSILHALSHLGFTIPPQADCGWIGEIGPGASYGDDGAGFDNEFTQRNTTLKVGCRFDFENPEHRI